MASGGAQQTLGIVLTMDASGVVNGANLADAAYQKVEQSATRATTAIDAQGKNMGQSLQLAGASAAAGLATLGAGHAMKEKVLDPMMDDAKEFERGFADLVFMTGATGEELAMLKKTVIDTGIKTQFDPTEAVQALYELRSSGLDTALALKALPAVLDLATGSAGQLGLADSATTAAVAMLKLQDTGDDTRRIIDKMAESTRQTNIHWKDLPIMMNSIGTAASILNVRTEDVLGTLGALRNAGQMPAQAGNSLMGFARRMLTVQRQVDKYVDKYGELGGKKMPVLLKNFQEFGVAIFDTRGKMRPLVDVASDFASAQKKFGTDQRFLTSAMNVFGQQGLALLMSIMKMRRGSLQGADAYRELVRTIGQTGDSARTAAAGIEATSVGQAKFLRGSIQSMNILIGTPMKSLFRPFKQLLIDNLNLFLAWADANPELVRTIAVVLVAVTGLLTALGTGLGVMAGVYMWSATLGPMFLKMGGMAHAARMGLSAIGSVLWPLTLALAAGVAMWLAYKNNLLGFRDFVDTFAADIKGIFFAIFDIIEGREVSYSDTWKKMSVGAREFVFFLIELKNRAIDFGKGFIEGIRGPLTVGVVVFTFLVQAIGWVLAAIGRMASAFGRAALSTKGASKSAAGLGIILGTVVGWMFLWKVAMIGYAAAVAIYTAAVSAYTFAVKLASFAQAAFNLVCMANPYVLIVLGIMLLIAAIVLLIVYWDELSSWMDDTFWKGKFSWVGEAIDAIADDMVLPFMLVYSAVVWLVDNIGWLIDTLADIIAYPFIEGAKAIWAAMVWIGTAASTVFWGIVDTIADAMASGIMWVWEGLVGIWAAISGVGESLWEAGANAISALWEGMKAVWDRMVKWFEEGVQYIRDLWPFSRAKEGPWSVKTPEQAGGNVVKYLTQGASEQWPVLAQTFEQGVTGLSNMLPGADQPTGPLASYDLGQALALGGGMFGGMPMSVPGSDVAVAPSVPTAVDPMARIEQLMSDLVLGSSAPQPVEKNVTITVGDTVVHVVQASEEEAERLAKLVTIKIKNEIQNLMDSEYE